jgi:hypothetical protein
MKAKLSALQREAVRIELKDYRDELLIIGYSERLTMATLLKQQANFAILHSQKEAF